jgi:predicted DNA repair protein MutK
MSVGLLALLDDVAALAKMGAASLDDIAAQATKAGTKAAGVVIDDAAVTPRYVTGFAAERELPIVGKIALGSLRNKLIFLLPGALLLSYVAPWTITPLLMVGGLYLSYEGAEKVYEKLFPHGAHAHEEKVDAAAATSLKVQEDRRVASAIKTDFILSAEIMAITLAGLPDDGTIWTRAIVLALVGIGVTVGVYGAVALIVKADDAGMAMAANDTENGFGSLVRGIGRGLVVGMPVFLKILTVVGTAAMIWVGGGILVHGLEHYGVHFPAHEIEIVAEAAAHAVPAAAGFVHWLVVAAGSGIAGLVAGAVLIPLVGSVLAPAWVWVNGLRA